MYKYVIAGILLLGLFGCSPLSTDEPIAAEDIEDLTEGNKPLWSNNGGGSSQRINRSQQQVIYLSNPSSVPSEELILDENTLSFEDWKKAKESNTEEYQDFLEYKEYLRVQNLQKAQ